jgi:hypothetical protein
VPAAHNACVQGKLRRLRSPDFQARLGPPGQSGSHGKRRARQSPDRSRRSLSRCADREERERQSQVFTTLRGDMDFWRGGSPVRGILGWILSVVQARRVGHGDAPYASQRAAAGHRRPVLASIRIAPRQYHGRPQRPSGVVHAYAGWVHDGLTSRLCAIPRRWLSLARGSRNREAHAPLWRCTRDARPGACKHARG